MENPREFEFGISGGQIESGLGIWEFEFGIEIGIGSQNHLGSQIKTGIKIPN